MVHVGNGRSPVGAGEGDAVSGPSPRVGTAVPVTPGWPSLCCGKGIGWDMRSAESIRSGWGDAGVGCP